MEGRRERRWKEEVIREGRRKGEEGIGRSLWYSDKQNGGGVGEIKQVVI